MARRGAALHRRGDAQPRRRDRRFRPPIRVEGGAKSFISKGTNGRWRDVLTAAELAAYDAKAAQLLTSDAIAWLEKGRGALR